MAGLSYKMRIFRICDHLQTLVNYSGAQVKGDEMGGAYSTYVGEDKCTLGFVWSTHLKGGGHFESLCLDGNVINRMDHVDRVNLASGRDK